MTVTGTQPNTPHIVTSSNGSTHASLLRWREALASGKHWEDAMLEALGMWTLPSERVDSREFVYLIEGEAFDWLVAAERLLLDAPTVVPFDEQERLLFEGRFTTTTPARFKAALGHQRRRAHLNFFYGVVVEEALWLAVESEVMKQRSVRGVAHSIGIEDGVAERLYERSFEHLRRAFHRARGQRKRARQSLAEWKSFIYWCWRLRLAHHDKARIASDTQKGLAQLAALRRADGSFE